MVGAALTVLGSIGGRGQLCKTFILISDEFWHNHVLARIHSLVVIGGLAFAKKKRKKEKGKSH